MDIFATDAYVGRMSASNRLRFKAALMIAGFVLGSMTGCAGNPEPKAVPQPVQSTALPSPSWTPPPPGHWTMKDLEVGRVAPPEELEKLMPISQLPDEPATIEQATEQGAKDAILYFAEISQVAFQQRSNVSLKAIDSEICNNCDALIRSYENADIKTEVYWKNPTYEIGYIEKPPSELPFYRARVDMSWRYLVTTDSTDSKIVDLVTDHENSRYYGVAFYNGRWRPVFMNGDRGADDGR